MNTFKRKIQITEPTSWIDLKPPSLNLMKFKSIALLLTLCTFPFSSFALDPDYGNIERTKFYEGTWGPRILLPTTEAEADFENFDIPAFLKQVDQLKSASYIMINISKGHSGNYHSSPNPLLQEVFGIKHFPDRDLFGEVLDSLIKRGLKVLVYQTSTGFDWDPRYTPDTSTKGKWEAFLKSEGISHWDAVSKFIVKYYSDKYGEKISGWWFDRTKKNYGDNENLTTDAQYRTMAKAARSGNPHSILTFHHTTGPINRGTPYCDYTAGHPHPMKFSDGPWDAVNLRMVTAIEAGPYFKGPYKNDPEMEVPPTDGGTLGQIFMPFQRNWKNGAASFPPDQAFDWMNRVMKAGGFHTWAVARVGGLFAEAQFKQLLALDAQLEPVTTRIHQNNNKRTSNNSFNIQSKNNSLLIATEKSLAANYSISITNIKGEVAAIENIHPTQKNNYQINLTKNLSKGLHVANIISEGKKMSQIFIQ